MPSALHAAQEGLASTRRRFRAILVGADFSGGLEWAVPAAQWVAAPGARFQLTHVLPEFSSEAFSGTNFLSSLLELRIRRQKTAEARLREAAVGAGKADADLSVVSGSVAPSLLDECTRFGADLIIVGTHRRGDGRIEIGSKARAVLRASPLSVLVARERQGADPAQPLSTIAVATDFTRCDLEAGRWAVDLAREKGARLRMVHVVDPLLWWDEWSKPNPADLDATHKTWGAIQAAHRHRLSEFQRQCPSDFCDTDQLSGQPVEEILRYARTKDVDLLVVGTRSQPRSVSLPLGSVAGELADRAPCSVLVWRQPPTDDSQVIRSETTRAARART